MITTVMTSGGQVVIPTKIRRKLNIKNGTRLSVEEGCDEIILKPIKSEYLAKIPGILPTKGKLSRLLLEERKKDKEKEA
jgi:AbrB family looped-hinge helix DNA binding protein